MSSSPDPLQATLIYDGPPSSGAAGAGGMHGAASADAAAQHEAFRQLDGRVGVLASGQQAFADETAGVLQTRLKSSSLAMGLILALVLPLTLARGDLKYLVLRVLVLLILGACFLVTYLKPRLKLRELRWLEILVFGVTAIQIVLVAYNRVSQAVRDEDLAAAMGAKNYFLGIWSVFMVSYAMFMPNSWRRAAIVQVIAGLVPYALIWWAWFVYDEASKALLLDRNVTIVPVPLMAAAIGIWGSHVINSIRREAYQARQYGQYRLTEHLGSGGMGEVFKAEHRMLKRPCAIKLIRPTDVGNVAALARFEREVQATAALSHWNTVEIFDYGRTDDGTFYYAMEYLPGLTLEELVNRHGPLPAPRAVHFLRQVCAALREAHSQGLIHRDIKPGNIFAAERGGVYDVAKLLDFGLVKGGDDNAGGSNSGGGISGSPLFMAPEQGRSFEDTDSRSDIYALGAVAYFLLTGKPPFEGKTPLKILHAHATNPVTPPSQINSMVPPDLEQVVLTCLAKDPVDRYQSAADLQAALDQVACAGIWTDADAAEWWKPFSTKFTTTDDTV